jgi:Mg2+ and Co2+ transporter CorA
MTATLSGGNFSLQLFHMRKQFKKLTARYNSPQSERQRKIGRAINHLGVLLQTTLASVEIATQMISPSAYIFVMLGIAILQWVGTTITDFGSQEQNCPVEGDLS